MTAETNGYEAFLFKYTHDVVSTILKYLILLFSLTVKLINCPVH